MNTVRYVGHGVEIEDDASRLRRRSLEFRGGTTEFRDGTACRVHRGRSQRRRRARGPASIMSAVTGRWR